ncbi:Trans-cinnamate 4-monooxygenase, partial [Zea mays]
MCCVLENFSKSYSVINFNLIN